MRIYNYDFIIIEVQVYCGLTYAVICAIIIIIMLICWTHECSPIQFKAILNANFGIFTELFSLHNILIPGIMWNSSESNLLFGCYRFVPRMNNLQKRIKSIIFIVELPPQKSSYSRRYNKIEMRSDGE